MAKYGLLLLPVLVGAGCGGDGLGQVFPDLRVCASEADRECAPPLALGAFRTGLSHDTAVYVRNLGTGILEVRELSRVSGSAVTLGTPPTRVGAHDSAPAPLSLVPPSGLELATLRLVSNDPATPVLEFDLTFEGVAPVLVACPTPGVTATPNACSENLRVDIGPVRPTQVVDTLVLVRNAGNASLTLAAQVTDESTRTGELVVLTSTSAGSMAPGGDSPLVVRFAPQDGLGDRLTVTLTPDDGVTPPAVVTFYASTPTNDPPQAVAVELSSGLTSVTGEVAQGLWLDGRASADPEGDPLVYRWSVVARPAASAAVLQPADATMSQLIPDVLGSYTVQLQVEDSLGLSDFADVEVSVEPRYALGIEVSWLSGGDVDLHVVPAGDALFSAADCFFLQPSRDWGVAGNWLDDCALGGDGESGPGSELIVIPRPMPASFDVYANYFADLGASAPITLTVWRDDASATLAQATTTLAVTCDTVKLGTIDWSVSQFVPVSDPTIACCYGSCP